MHPARRPLRAFLVALLLASFGLAACGNSSPASSSSNESGNPNSSPTAGVSAGSTAGAHLDPAVSLPSDFVTISVVLTTSTA